MRSSEGVLYPHAEGEKLRPRDLNYLGPGLLASKAGLFPPSHPDEARPGQGPCRVCTAVNMSSSDPSSPPLGPHVHVTRTQGHPNTSQSGAEQTALDREPSVSAQGHFSHSPAQPSPAPPECLMWFQKERTD